MRARSRSSRRHPPIQRADLPRRYYERELRPVSVGEVGLAVGRVGWILVRGGLNEVRTDEHGTRALPHRHRPLPANPQSIPPEGAEQAMTPLESADYQIAHDRIKGNPVISKMAAGVATVPLAELAHQDGTPRFAFMQHTNRAFDRDRVAERGNPATSRTRRTCRGTIGLIAEAVLAERAAIRKKISNCGGY